MRFLAMVFVLFLMSSRAYAQDPFSISTADRDSARTRTVFGKNTKLTEKNAPEHLDLFGQQALGASASGEYANGNVSVNVIQYRLGVYSKAETRGGSTDTTRYYLPFVLLTKLQTNYDNNFAAADDLTGYDGGPVTARLMPSYNRKVGPENLLMVGVIADFRAIAYKDTVETDTQFDFAFYTSLGITYSGRGKVTDENRKVYDGRWSSALLAYFCTASKSVRESVFENGDSVVGAEFLFRFKVNDTALKRFNLFASVKWMSEKIINTGDNVIFKVAVGN